MHCWYFILTSSSMSFLMFTFVKIKKCCRWVNTSLEMNNFLFWECMISSGYEIFSQCITLCEACNLPAIRSFWGAWISSRDAWILTCDAWSYAMHEYLLVMRDLPRCMNIDSRCMDLQRCMNINLRCVIFSNAWILNRNAWSSAMREY